MQEHRPPAVVALAADLFFASRIRAAAEAAGFETVLPRSREAAAAAIEDNDVGLLLIDLDVRWTDPVAFIADIVGLGGDRPRIVAFVSHVRTDAIEAARSAGADRVLARSAFVRELPMLLAGSRSED